MMSGQYRQAKTRKTHSRKQHAELIGNRREDLTHLFSALNGRIVAFTVNLLNSENAQVDRSLQRALRLRLRKGEFRVPLRFVTKGGVR